MHLLQLPFAIYTEGDSLLMIGFTQGLYVFPALLVSLMRQRYGMAVGFIIGAALALLLSFAVCAGAFGFHPGFLSLIAMQNDLDMILPSLPAPDHD